MLFRFRRRNGGCVEKTALKILGAIRLRRTDILRHTNSTAVFSFFSAGSRTEQSEEES